MANIIRVDTVSRHPSGGQSHVTEQYDGSTPIGRRLSAHRAMTAAIEGCQVTWQRGESADRGETFAGPSTVVYIPHRQTH